MTLIDDSVVGAAAITSLQIPARIYHYFRLGKSDYPLRALTWKHCKIYPLYEEPMEKT